MSTRSRIGIENADGTVSSIYCHNDGYPSGVGNILTSHYTDREKVQALIGLGDISELDERLTPTPGTPHSFDGLRESGVVVAYHRDRGEVLRSPRVDKGFKEFRDSDVEDYGYVFTIDGEWFCIEGYESIRSFVKISELL